MDKGRGQGGVHGRQGQVPARGQGHMRTPTIRHSTHDPLQKQGVCPCPPPLSCSRRRATSVGVRVRPSISVGFCLCPVSARALSLSLLVASSLALACSPFLHVPLLFPCFACRS